jgi:hypothetical protein
MKPSLTLCKRLLDTGFSLLTVGESKVPNFAWKSTQEKQLSKQEFEKRWAYESGITKKNGEPLPPTHNVGIVCGFWNVEVIDIDLKVFDTLAEQQEFWKEYESMLRDNIDDFDDKFIIAKTVNNGYHILYRCEEISGNTKIAKMKDSAEYIIETRGKGGYVFIYDKVVSKLSYVDIKEISIRDRETLWDISKLFHNPDPEPEIKPTKKDDIINECLTPWEDFNLRNDVLDVVGDEFTIIRNNKDRIIIKRHGASSPHSGYIYKNSGCMYLFTTGTIYPNEKLLSPYACYTYKHHNGDFKASASDLYSKNYGERKKAPVPVIDPPPKIDKSKLRFPVEIFPQSLQNYMIDSAQKLNLSIDYMGCSLLWVISVIIGNTHKIRVKNGWVESPVLWISLVGKTGIGKTPSINHITFPLVRKNKFEIKDYIKNLEKWEHYNGLTKEEKKNAEEIKEPRKTQFIVNDVTLEALVEMHQDNKNSIGILKDELAGWFKDMNKYRAGSDLEFWLSSFNGNGISLNRKTSRSSFVESPHMPVLGGIQPEILPTFFNSENKSNGFVDRVLLSYPDLDVENFNDAEIDIIILDWYDSFISNMYDKVKRNIDYDTGNEIITKMVTFSPDGKEEFIRVHNKITNMQRSDDENEYIKSMLSKQKSYLPRFALLIQLLSNYESGDNEVKYVNESSVKKAELLSDYFIESSKKVKIDSNDKKDINNIIFDMKKASNKEKIEAVYSVFPNAKNTDVANALSVSKAYVSKVVKQMQ